MPPMTFSISASTVLLHFTKITSDPRRNQMNLRKMMPHENVHSWFTSVQICPCIYSQVLFVFCSFISFSHLYIGCLLCFCPFYRYHYVEYDKCIHSYIVYKGIFQTLLLAI
jgi:hypothetical protein